MRLGVLLLICLGCITGYFGAAYYQGSQSYKLDYHTININLPVVYGSSLSDKTYPLGEKYLGEMLQAEFTKQKYKTYLAAMDDTFQKHHRKSGIEFYMRSFPELSLSYDFISKDKIAVIYETVPYNFQVIQNADIVFTGSLKKEHEYRQKGINAHFIPQFTTKDRFYPAYDQNYKHRVLFIANQWPDHKVRKSVAYAMEKGIDVDVYGASWNGVLTGLYASWWKGFQIENEKLKYYYSSADIVLNDTREDMIKAGFISNRIFDVTACKGFLISDYIPELEKIYGDAIPMYKTKEEFYDLITYYLAHPEERREKAEKAYRITMENFVAEKSIQKMIGIIQDFQKEMK